MKKSSSLPVTRPSRLATSRVAGFTLIEVMVALIVLVLGVLGAAAMTLTAIRDGKQSGLRSQASALAYELGDLMRANPNQEAVFTGAPPGAVGTCWTTGCSLIDTANNDFHEWNAKLTNPTIGLPNGAYVICRDATKLADANYPNCDNQPTSPLVVKLKWDEKKNDARSAQATTSAVQTQYLTVTLQPY